jgi:DNA-directed RNA polymerase specialized sigma24 family protein
LSEVNLSIAFWLQNKNFRSTGDVAMWSYVHKIIISKAINLSKHRSRMGLVFSETSIDDIFDVDGVYQANFSEKDLLMDIVKDMPFTIRCRRQNSVFEAYFIRQLSLDEVCEETHLTLPIVNLYIRNIRKVINEKYGKRYREIYGVHPDKGKTVNGRKNCGTSGERTENQVRNGQSYC